jgi:hypothetical protein
LRALGYVIVFGLLGLFIGGLVIFVESCGKRRFRRAAGALGVAALSLGAFLLLVIAAPY